MVEFRWQYFPLIFFVILVQSVASEDGILTLPLSRQNYHYVVEMGIGVNKKHLTTNLQYSGRF